MSNIIVIIRALPILNRSLNWSYYVHGKKTKKWAKSNGIWKTTTTTTCSIKWVTIIVNICMNKILQYSAPTYHLSSFPHDDFNLAQLLILIKILYMTKWQWRWQCTNYYGVLLSERKYTWATQHVFTIFINIINYEEHWTILTS